MARVHTDYAEQCENHGRHETDKSGGTTLRETLVR